jgi:sulfatase modifying factor 1
MEQPHPLAVNWMITYRCNGRCRFCLTESGPLDTRPELSAEGKLRAIEILASLGVRRISIMGGEPFVLDELAAVVRCACLHGITVNLTTAGRDCAYEDLLAIRNGLQYLNVSLDGPIGYNDRYRGKGGYDGAVQTIRNAGRAGIPVRMYTVLTTENSDRETIQWFFRTARELSVMLIMFIFLSPTGRASDCWDLRVPMEERGAILDAIAEASREYGVRYKDCDPYLPESFKLFLDADGSLYKHQGRGIKEDLGYLLDHPDGRLWHLLSEEDQQEHWQSFSDLLGMAPCAESAASQAPAGMAYVPPGVFLMGGTLLEREGPIHPVYLDGFYIDTHQVTNQEFADFLNAKGNQVEEVGAWLNLGSPHCLIERVDGRFRPKTGFESYPAVEVSWYGARAYAAWRGKRLPTEAEWEKAALGGVNGHTYPWGEDPPGDQCNWLRYDGAYKHLRPDFYHGRGPLPVGLFPPNPYGLYDMAGNVWEWCSDWFSRDAYTEGLRVNPRGPATGGKKVLRGGSWSFDPINLRVAHRSYAYPGEGYSYDGFRCVVSNIQRLKRQFGLDDG